ncbi:MAG: cysteine synthase family protein [Bacteroidetes bacterium]|nr:cysteine synthase family protein [Bacteroidota bacterium]MBL0016245.1 cysteine synthase family protein [Bacteroidota bacterium]MBP6640942.1 cysteine synthase family protein [Bacteroidia bacterium]
MNTVTQLSPLQSRLHSLAAQVGNTPLVPIRRLLNKPGVEVYVKLEWHQIGQSVKARAAYQIILQAVKAGLLNPEKTLLDATSGNTGIAYAAIGAAIGIQTKLVVPDNMAAARKQILKAYGAQLVFSDSMEGGDGAQRLAKEILAKDPEAYFYADQYSNPANVLAHTLGTAPEIWAQTQGRITHFVSSLGTTGSFVGTSAALKKLNPQIQAIELQPDIAMHAMEGWKHLETSDVPKIYNPAAADARLVVTTDEAYAMMRDAARYEGLLLSSSSAGNLVGALALAKSISEGVIVTLLPDSAEKSIELFPEIFI